MFGKPEISNFERKCLFVSTLVIPVAVFGTILFIAALALSSVVCEYFAPPRQAFAVDGGGYYHPFLAGFRILIALSLMLSGVFIFYKRISLSILTLFFPIAMIVVRTFIVFRDVYDEHFGYQNQTLIDIFVRTIEFTDTVFLIFILALFFWQISILFRILIKALQRKSKLL